MSSSRLRGRGLHTLEASQVDDRWKYRIEHVEYAPPAMLSIDESLKLRQEQPERVYEKQRERDRAADAYLLQILNDLGTQGWGAFEILRSDVWIRTSERQTKVAWTLYLKRRTS